MTGTVSIMLALIIVGLPTVMITVIVYRFMRLREKKLEVEAIKAGESAAQFASSNASLEQRVRVLEQIVTDGGAQTAAQIEALRAPSLNHSASRASADGAAA